MLIEPQFRTPATDAIWSAPARLRRMLDFEAALAEAQAESGLIPRDAARIIAHVCARAALDPDGVFDEAAAAGNPAIPFAGHLTRLVGEADAAASSWVHYGATSQDLIDTATMLGLRANVDAVLDDADALADALAALALRHAETPVAGRTLLQQATPVTFGVKAALWTTAVDRARATLAGLRGDALAVQLGGAVGTLAAFGASGPAVRAGLARRLGLADPGFCWHTVRDRVFRVACALVELTGALGKIARDVELLMQPEIGEAAEPVGEGRGGSSAMPHKRNPVDAVVAAAVAITASGLLASLANGQVQEHERAAGAWHAEWIVLPALGALAHAATRALMRIAEGMEVNPGRMRANLDLHRGLLAAEALSAALAPALGRSQAQALVRSLSQRVRDEGADLRALARREPRITENLSPDGIDEVFAHRRAIAAAAAETRRLLASRTPARQEREVKP